MGYIDLVHKCGVHTFVTLFPNKIKNKPLVYFINIIHIIGVLFIQLGLLLPVPALKYYILYITFLFITYILLNNQCFMTLVSNYYSKQNYNALCIKMNEAKIVLAGFLVLAIIFVMYPQIAPYNLIKKYIFKAIN